MLITALIVTNLATLYYAIEMHLKVRLFRNGLVEKYLNNM